MNNALGYAGLDGVNSYEGWNDTSRVCRTKVAKMINLAGEVVTPSVESAQSAVRSLANRLLFESYCPAFGLCADIVDADGTGSWPITAITYIIVPTFTFDIGDACSRARSVYDYVSWLLTDPEVSIKATDLMFAIIPDLVSKVSIAIVRNMSCIMAGNKTRAITDLSAAMSIKGSGSSLQKELQLTLTNSYYIETSVSINYVPSGSGQGKADLLSGAVDFAGSESPFTAAQYRSDPVVLARRFQMIPVFASPIAIVYNVPAIADLILTRSAVNALFVCNITSWADPSIVAANEDSLPQYNPPDRAIVRVVRADSSGTTQVRRALRTSDAAMRARSKKGKARDHARRPGIEALRGRK